MMEKQTKEMEMISQALSMQIGNMLQLESELCKFRDSQYTSTFASQFNNQNNLKKLSESKKPFLIKKITKLRKISQINSKTPTFSFITEKQSQNDLNTLPVLSQADQFSQLYNKRECDDYFDDIYLQNTQHMSIYQRLHSPQKQPFNNSAAYDPKGMGFPSPNQGYYDIYEPKGESIVLENYHKNSALQLNNRSNQFGLQNNSSIGQLAEKPNSFLSPLPHVPKKKNEDYLDSYLLQHRNDKDCSCVHCNSYSGKSHFSGRKEQQPTPFLKKNQQYDLMKSSTKCQSESPVSPLNQHFRNLYLNEKQEQNFRLNATRHLEKRVSSNSFVLPILNGSTKNEIPKPFICSAEQREKDTLGIVNIFEENLTINQSKNIDQYENKSSNLEEISETNKENVIKRVKRKYQKRNYNQDLKENLPKVKVEEIPIYKHVVDQVKIEEEDLSDNIFEERKKCKKFPSVVFIRGHKIFECQICMKTFDSKQKLGGHKARAHPHAPCQRTDREQKKLEKELENQEAKRENNKKLITRSKAKEIQQTNESPIITKHKQQDDEEIKLDASEQQSTSSRFRKQRHDLMMSMLSSHHSSLEKSNQEA